MKSWFMSKGYDAKTLDLNITRAKRTPRSEALKPKARKNKAEVRPLVLDFHPSLSQASNIIKDLFPILSESGNTSQVFTSAPIVSFRRPKNLKACRTLELCA